MSNVIRELRAMTNNLLRDAVPLWKFIAMRTVDLPLNALELEGLNEEFLNMLPADQLRCRAEILRLREMRVEGERT